MLRPCSERVEAPPDVARRHVAGRQVVTAALDQPLVETLLSLTDAAGTDHDPAELLYILTTASVRLLDVDAAAVLLIDEDGRLVPVAATHDSTDELENLQIQVLQGPCLECARTGSAVSSEDLDVDEHRWPEFARLAREEGFRSVHAQPLHLRGTVVGALNLLRRRAGPLRTKDRKRAGQLAAAATIGLLHSRALHDAETVKAQLQHALDSRIDIEQAKGVLVERHGLTPGAAFERLRCESRRSHVPLRQLARAVLDKSPDAP